MNKACTVSMKSRLYANLNYQNSHSIPYRPLNRTRGRAVRISVTFCMRLGEVHNVTYKLNRKE